MLTKNEVLKSLQSLPGKFQAEDAIEQIVLLEKIRIGIEQSKNKQLISNEEAKRKLRKWLK